MTNNKNIIQNQITFITYRIHFDKKKKIREIIEVPIKQVSICACSVLRGAGGT